MESNFSNRDFEQYVKKNADEYRMFPSEKVWKGVNSALHARKRWSGLGLAFLLLLTGGAVTWVMSSYPVSNKSTAEAPPALKVETAEPLAPEKVETILAFKHNLSQEPVSNRSSIAPSPLVADIDQIVAEAKEETNSLADVKNNLLIKPEVNRSASIINNIGIQGFSALIAQKPAHDPALVDNDLALNTPKAKTPTEAAKETSNTELPLTIESVVNTYKFRKPAKKVSWQVFITPTISYRKLSTNKSYENSALTGTPFVSLTDVNKVVTHKPDMGLQIGFTGTYPLSRILKIRAGVQANVNRYDIKAFAYNTEMVTINLNSNAGSSTVSAATNYRNYGGYKTDWIKNYYLSVSIPVGAELTLFGNEKRNFGIAGTIQPTYIVSDRAYLISTDYKNYAKVPWLIRHVNVSTGVEAFVNYSNGKTRWQVGPQARYQMLSSFQNKYPVKENLFDFGVKIGVFLNEH